MISSESRKLIGGFGILLVIVAVIGGIAVMRATDSAKRECPTLQPSLITVRASETFNVTVMNGTEVLQFQNDSYNSILVALLGSSYSDQLFDKIYNLEDSALQEYLDETYGENYSLPTILNFVTLTRNSSVLFPMTLDSNDGILDSIDGGYTYFDIASNFTQVILMFNIGIDMVNYSVAGNQYYTLLCPFFNPTATSIGGIMRSLADRYICQEGNNITFTLLSAKFDVGEWEGSYWIRFPEITEVTVKVNDMTETFMAL